MKVSVTSYSYSQVIGKDGFTIYDAMTHAKNIGIEGFEFAGITPPEGMTGIEYAKELKAYSESIGLPIVAFLTGANFGNRDLDAEVERLCGDVDIAQALGVPVMRHDVASGIPDWFEGVRTYGTILPRLAEGCRRVTEYAASKGIRTCTENHGRFAQDSDRIVALVEAVNNTNYGTLCDIGNFLCADDDCAIAVGKVAPFTYHVHAKDFLVKSGMQVSPGKGWLITRAGNYLRGTIIGHGEVPVAQAIGILERAGYQGYVTIEFEGFEKTLEAIEVSAENLRRYINAIN